MSKALRAINGEGKIEPLEQVDLPEGIKVLVTLLPDGENEFWLQTSQASLDVIWDNPEDIDNIPLLRPSPSRLGHAEFQTGLKNSSRP